MISVVRRASRRVRRIVDSRARRRDAKTYLSSLGIAVETYPTLIVCARAYTTRPTWAHRGESVSQRLEGERYIFESRLVVCPPHTHTHPHPPSCPPTARNQSIDRSSTASVVARTFTASLLHRRRRRRRGRRVHRHRSRVSSHASTHRGSSTTRPSRCAATPLERANDRGEPRRVADGTIDSTTSSTILHCTTYIVSTGTDDDAVFY